MQCLYCGKDVPQIPGKRERLYCDNKNVCKQLAYKKRKAIVNTPLVDDMPVNSVQRNSYTEMLSELVELRTKVSDQAQTIASQKHALEVDVWYHLDSEARGLKAWLKKQRKTPLIEKLLADQFLPAKPTSRAMFERYLRSKGYTADDLAEFAHLWKALIKGEALQS
jgi:hypothetical protein